MSNEPMTSTKVVVIVGPTSSGKSSLAVRLARKFSGEIISADSRQVYKYVNIGSGKITLKEMGGIPHHGLSITHPRKVFTAAEFATYGKKKIREILSRGHLSIIVGGTGFYIDALLYDSPFPKVLPNKKLRSELGKLRAETLHQMLQKKDAMRAATIDKENKTRIIRALEIIAATGKPVPKLEKISPYEILLLGIAVDKDKLLRRIEQRLHLRIEKGLFRETFQLHEKYHLSWYRITNLSLEYEPAIAYAKKKIKKDEAVVEMLKRNKDYVKRQYTWFKKQKNIHWVKNTTEAKRLVKQFI